MNSMRKYMKNAYIAAASAVALSTALGITAAMAKDGASHVLSVPVVADYNAAQVKTAGDIVTVPSGLANYAVNQGSLEINSRFTVTLPTNFTFGSQPSLAASSATIFALIAGGIGSQSATFAVGTTPLAAGQNATLNTFSVAGVGALETPIPVVNALPITMQSTNNALITNNDPAPLTAPAFASEPGVTLQFVGGFGLIDLSPPSLGTLFLSTPDTPTGLVAQAVSVSPEIEELTTGAPILQPSGALNALARADTATLTISGLFAGIKTAFAATDETCQTSIATGTAEPTLLTIPGVPASGSAFSVCVTADGTTLLQQNPPDPVVQGFQAFTPAVSPGTSTDFLGTTVFNPGQPVQDDNLGLFTYVGGGILSVTNFFTGDDSGYSSLLRVNNAGSSSVNLFALAQPDTGGPALAGSIGSLDAGIGAVFTEQQIAAATGLTLTNSGARATLQLIISGDFSDVAASSFLVNPSGVVTNVGLQPNLPQ
jgi:hypothetical protein